MNGTPPVNNDLKVAGSQATKAINALNNSTDMPPAEAQEQEIAVNEAVTSMVVNTAAAENLAEKSNNPASSPAVNAKLNQRAIKAATAATNSAENVVIISAEVRKNIIIDNMKKSKQSNVFESLVKLLEDTSAAALLEGVFGKHANKNTLDSPNNKNKVLTMARLQNEEKSPTRLDVLEAILTVSEKTVNSVNANTGNNMNKAKTLNQAILAAVEGLTTPPSANE